MPEFPQAATENFPLIITFIIYSLMLIGGFVGFLKYGIDTVKAISASFTTAMRELSATFTSSVDKITEQNSEQTQLLTEIKNKLEQDDEERTRPRRRSLG